MLAAVGVAALSFSVVLIHRGQHDGGTLDRHGLDGLQRIYATTLPTPPIPAQEGPEAGSAANLG